jgi:hypothetical protein
MSLVDAGMVPFQKAYVMICEWGLSLRRASLTLCPKSLHDFRYPCWKPRIGTFIHLSISQFKLIARLRLAHLVRFLLFGSGFRTNRPIYFSLRFLMLVFLFGHPPLISLSVTCSWIFTKVVPEDSQADQALHFLLDHPRR